MDQQHKITNFFKQSSVGRIPSSSSTSSASVEEHSKLVVPEENVIITPITAVIDQSDAKGEWIIIGEEVTKAQLKSMSIQIKNGRRVLKNEKTANKSTILAATTIDRNESPMTSDTRRSTRVRRPPLNFEVVLPNSMIEKEKKPKKKKLKRTVDKNPKKRRIEPALIEEVNECVDSDATIIDEDCLENDKKAPTQDEIKKDDIVVKASMRLWTEKYRPSTEHEMVISTEAIRQFREWLANWNDNYLGGDDKKDDFGDDDELMGPSNAGKICFVFGPTGIGKTSLVYSIARDLGYNVLEHSAASQKITTSMIREELNESFRSHTINKHPIAAFFQKCQTKEAAAAPKATTTAGFGLSKSLILFDDFDGVLDDYQSLDVLWRSMREAFHRSKKPIVITSLVQPSVLANNDDIYLFKQIRLNLLSADSIRRRLANICEAEGLPEQVPSTFGGDLRKAVNELHFWADLRPSTSNLLPSEVGEEESEIRSELASFDDIYRNTLDRLSANHDTYNSHYTDHRLDFSPWTLNTATMVNAPEGRTEKIEDFLDKAIGPSRLSLTKGQAFDCQAHVWEMYNLGLDLDDYHRREAKRRVRSRR